jgi:hypothetical protein
MASPQESHHHRVNCSAGSSAAVSVACVGIGIVWVLQYQFVPVVGTVDDSVLLWNSQPVAIAVAVVGVNVHIVQRLNTEPSTN